MECVALTQDLPGSTTGDAGRPPGRLDSAKQESFSSDVLLSGVLLFVSCPNVYDYLSHSN